MSSNALVQFQSISKVYGSKFALKDINFTGSSGEIVGLLGANGAGKSTFIHLAAGVLKPTSGTIRIASSKIGWCSQRQMIDWFTDGWTNVWMGAKLAGYRGKVAEERTQQAIEMMGLQGENLKTTPEALSGGQQQWLMIARILAYGGDILLLDEPTVGLDLKSIEKFCTELVKLQKQGALIIVSSHELESIENILDRIYMLENGCQVFDGTVTDFIAQFVPNNTYEIVLSPKCQIDQQDIDLLNARVSVDIPANREFNYAYDSQRHSLMVTVNREIGLAKVLRELPDSWQVVGVTQRPATLRSALSNATT